MIKKRNLDPSLIQWIMSVTGLGPGIGEIFYVAPSSSATSQYRTQLQSMGVPDCRIFTLPSLAFAEAVAYRNDVILVAPGAYAETASIAWNKANTHMIGLGGPNTMGDYSEPNVVVYTATSAVAEVINITGYNCQFHNFTIANFGNNAGNLSAVVVDAYGCYFKNVTFQGTATAGNDDVVAAASLYIADGGGYPIFEDCTIGQNCWDVREGALSGVLRFTGTSGSAQPYNGKFLRCRFLSVSETATVAMVALPANYCLSGTWMFDNCSFENYSVNWGHNLNQAFYDNCGTTHGIILHHCVAIGIDEWQDADAGNNYIGADMPIVGLGGGLARNPTAVTGS